MTTFLLDINVLIALIDPAHVHHDPAHVWFAREGRKAWATCPLTENGVLRIVGHSRYPNAPGSPAVVSKLMIRFCSVRGHSFWPDDVSVLDRTDTDRILDSAQVSDTYLLALALAHSGRLATFDRRLVTDAVPRGRQALHVID